MIKKILLLTTLLSSANALAIDAWKGYKPIEKVSAPHKELAMASVFQILTVTLLEKNKNKYEVVDMSTTKTVTDVPRLRDDSRTFQIETCRNQGLKKCPIFTTKESGSGFVNNGHDFYTCRHMIHNWIIIAAKENSLTVDQVSPPIELLDYKKNLVYSSAAAGQNIMSIALINTDARLNYVLKKVPNLDNKVEAFFAFSEYVAMKSPVDLIPARAAPVSLAVANDETIFLSGYPGATKIFGGTKKGDTSGDQLVSSAGGIIEFSDQQQLLASKALASPGMSGGMATNSQGEIIGFACNGNDVGTEISSTAVMLNAEIHKAFWNYMLNTPL